MRQVKAKSLILKQLPFVLAILVLLAAGCRDNPQDKAAKQMHQQIEQALAQDDLSAAQQQVQSALSTYRSGGAAQDTARLVSGNLALNQGLQFQAELNPQTLPVRSAVDRIATQLIQSQNWLLDKERVEKMLALKDAEIVELKALISGTAQTPGLQARLTEAQAEKDTLTAERQTALQEKTAVQTVIDDSQARSEDLLRQADLASGDQKLSLQKQAYDLMLSRKDDYVKVQAAENQIALLDSRIELVQLRVDSLSENIRQTQAQIQALQTAPAREQLKTQLTEIDATLSEQQKRITALADAIKAGMDAYRQTAQTAIEHFQQAVETYQQVRTAGPVAPIRQADSAAYAAMVNAEQMRFVREIAQRLSTIVAAADESLVRGLAERLPLGVDFDQEQFDKVMALFDQADTAYDNAVEQARRIPQRGQEAACNVLQSQILAVYSKMQLADALAQYDLATQIQTRLDALKAKGQEFGSQFTLSEVSQLIEKGLAYTPSLSVNVELYFEGIRQRLSEWKRLTTPDQQAAAVEANLAEMDDLVRKFGDKMAQLLEPLKQEMLTAKDRGFVAPAGAGGEPNSL